MIRANRYSIHAGGVVVKDNRPSGGVKSKGALFRGAALFAAFASYQILMKNFV